MWVIGFSDTLHLVRRMEGATEEMRYTYKCNKCFHEFDKEQKLENVLNHVKHSKVRCPICHGTTRKLINTPAIHFLGNGWGKDKK